MGVGVPLSTLSQFATNLKVGSGDKTAEAAKYQGGEIRKERSSPLTTVAVAVEAAGLNKEKDVLACAVLQRAIGTGPRVKWGTSVSPLHRQLSSAGSADQFAVSAFNVAYTDSGLLGFILCSVPSAADSVSFSPSRLIKTDLRELSYGLEKF